MTYKEVTVAVTVRVPDTLTGTETGELVEFALTKGLDDLERDIRNGQLPMEGPVEYAIPHTTIADVEVSG